MLSGTGKIEPGAARPAAARRTASRRGRYTKSVARETGTAYSLLVQGAVNPRPDVLRNHASSAASVTFLEQPMLARKSGWDRYITSGGRKGGTETWLSDTDGVLKRYVRVVGADPGQPVVKGAQYSLLQRSGPGAAGVEDKTKYCWIIKRTTAPDSVPIMAATELAADPAQSSIFVQSSAPGEDESEQTEFAEWQQLASQELPFDLAPQLPQVQTAMELVAGPKQSFISFQGSALGEDGLELGAIGTHRQTVLAFHGSKTFCRQNIRIHCSSIAAISGL
jgi:hypothetical protein